MFNSEGSDDGGSNPPQPFTKRKEDADTRGEN